MSHPIPTQEVNGEESVLPEDVESTETEVEELEQDPLVRIMSANFTETNRRLDDILDVLNDLSEGLKSMNESLSDKS